MNSENILSTSIPDAEGARTLLFQANENQKVDLKSLLISCSNKLHYDLSDLVEFVDNIDTSRQLIPAYYLYVQQLRDAIKTSSITNIMDAIQHLSWLQTYGVYVTNFKISSILSEYWEDSYVATMRQYEQKNICGESTIVRPISLSELKIHASNIEKALHLISISDPEVYAEIKILIVSIKLFQGRVLRGQASGNTLGAIWLRVPDENDDQVGYWIEHIVHEVSHLKLHAMFYQERFVLNADDERIFKAPIRDDLRPMLGVFHATFVLSRMVRIFRLLSFKGFATRFRDRLQLCQLQFEIGLNSVFSENAKLTENGKLIRESFKKCAFIPAK